MLNFAFKNRTEILFGKDQINEIASRVPSQGKVMFLYGGGSIKKNGVYDDVVNALEGVDFVEFSG
ncbi:MAG TPA: NADH-dependent alcohol dehydrogenase, partial [Pseudoalteromonas sp.]|nr:NADH-dependent alcohol dehydrogenase [Pseudoalteromonas sp.]